MRRNNLVTSEKSELFFTLKEALTIILMATDGFNAEITKKLN